MLESRALFVVLVVLPGCLDNVVALEPRAESIKVVRETDKPLRCDVLGKISGTSRSANKEEARTGAENDFRNQAAKFKAANFAFIEAERSGPVGTSSQQDVFIGGKALRCQTEEMEEADEKAAAAAREQKEKEEAEQKAKDDEAKAEAKKKPGKK